MSTVNSSTSVQQKQQQTGVTPENKIAANQGRTWFNAKTTALTLVALGAVATAAAYVAQSYFGATTNEGICYPWEEHTCSILDKAVEEFGVCQFNPYNATAR